MDELEQNKDKIFWTWSKILIFSQRKNVFRKKIFFKIFKISTSNSKHFPPSKYFSPLALHQSQSQCQVRLISPYQQLRGGRCPRSKLFVKKNVK